MTNHQSRRLNYLKRVLKVHEAHNAVWEEDLTKKYIWRKYINERYNISYYTYLEYLGINARKEMKKLKTEIDHQKQQIEEMKKQISLFTLLLPIVITLSSCGMFQECLEGAALAQYCADTYPCKDSLIVDTLHEEAIWEIPQDTIIYIDRDTCPVTQTPIYLTDTANILVPGRTIKVPYTIIDSTWYRQDSAQITALRMQLIEKNATIRNMQVECLTGTKNNADMPLWWLAITGIGGFLIRHFAKRKNTQHPNT